MHLTYDQIETISCPMEEQETTVVYSRSGDIMKIYTSDNTTLTDLKKKLKDNPEDWKCYVASKNNDGTVSGYFFEAPKDLLTFRTKKVTRELTEEQKQAITARLKASKNK